MRFPVKALIVVLFAVTLFLPGINGGFLLDDGVTILKNYVLYINDLNFDDLIYAALSFHHGHGERALPMLTFALALTDESESANSFSIILIAVILGKLYTQSAN